MPNFISKILGRLGMGGRESEHEAGRSNAESQNASGEMTTNVTSMRVSVTDGAIMIDEVAIDLPCSFQSISDLFGEPSRALATIRIWDDQGIFAHLTPDLLTVENLTLAYRHFEADHWPEKYFDGHMVIDGKQMTASTTEKELKAKGYEKFGSILWFRQSGQREIDIQMDENGLVSVYIAPDN